MNKISEAKTKKLIQISNYYYMEGLSQQEISERMGVSRPQVSRLLTQARECGIVTISIKNPYSEEQKYERWLKKKYNLENVVVVDVSSNDEAEQRNTISPIIAELLNQKLKDGDNLGIMAGHTINNIGKGMSPIGTRDITVVPLVGGLNSGEDWQANVNVHVFSSQLKCRYIQLNAPYFVGSAEAKDILLKEIEIKKALMAAQRSDVALIGIGPAEKGSELLLAAGFTPQERQELWEKGAVTSICNSFLNEKGEAVELSFENRMIGIKVSQLLKIPTVIAVAYGRKKVSAIASTLKGAWIDILVTTLDTAKQLIELD